MDSKEGTSKSGCAETPEQSPKNGLLPKKRKLAGETEVSKRPRLNNETQYSLVMFPDDVLLIILSHLDHGSLIRLKKTCTLFARLCVDHTFWRKVNFTDYPASAADLEDISNLVSEETTAMRVLGKYVEKDTLEDTLTAGWLLKIGSKCPNLETLAIPNHFINCQTINITAYPRTITRLDLSNTRLRNLPVGRSYFRDISSLIPNLASLILTNCDWFEPHSLMAISKCRKLEELRLNDCVQVKDCLAYCGLSTRGGFRALKTLDLRRCMVTTSELVCFSSVPSLTSLYLENMNESGLYSVIFIDPAILVLCTKNDQMHLDGDGAIAPMADRPHLLIEKLVIRHFQTLTNMTLSKLARDALTLKFLDVTGTGVTKDGIENFKNLRPSVTLIHNVSEE